ncbi:cell shape determination protein CcmA [Halorubrum sp. HHNYT27]|uniref:bactofilin family protein n=1 Tax=Halorubrum sp. HHNYT27 TaxID=3402275 RepID=UPI003EB76FA4
MSSTLSADRIRRTVAVLAVVALLFPLATGVTTAQSVQGASGAIIVDEGETVNGIEGVAGTIIVRGTVDGDLSGAAGSIHVTESGRVAGNIQAAAGTLGIDGTVGGSVEAGAGSFELTDSGRIGGSLDVGGGSINIDGAVGGDVRAGADSIVIGPNADVGGEFRYDAGTFTQSPDATVAGGVVEDPGLRGDTGITFGPAAVPAWVGSAYGVVVNLALGAVLLLVFPRFSRDVADRAGSDALVSGVVGAAVLIGTPILLVLVAITLIGIPLALVGAVAYAVALWIGSVYGRYALGSWLLDRLDRSNRWVALLLGVLAVAAIGFVPWIGGLVDLIVLLLGLGAFGVGLFDRYRGRRSQRVPDRGAVGAD